MRSCTRPPSVCFFPIFGKPEAESTIALQSSWVLTSAAAAIASSMAEGLTLGFSPQLDTEPMLREAQQRWLRPVEICEILQNYHKFHITQEPPNRPHSGSLFLFDRKALRHFRKDGHNWRKKKDGKTVKEAHEKLKAGSRDVLHCYYAHGEDNENFQRRSYWMLEEDFMHIVLVHYREVKIGSQGSKAIFLQPRENGDTTRLVHADSPTCTNSSPNFSHDLLQAFYLQSPNSTQPSEHEDTDSADNFQTSSGYNSFLEMHKYGPCMNVPSIDVCDLAPVQNDQYDYQRLQDVVPSSNSLTVAQVGEDRLVNESYIGLTSTPTKTETDMASWREIFERCTTGLSYSFDTIVSTMGGNTVGDSPQRNSVALGNIPQRDLDSTEEDGKSLLAKSAWKLFDGDEVGAVVQANTNVKNNQVTDGDLMKQRSDLSKIDWKGLKISDSISRWTSKEPGVDDSQIKSSSGICWGRLDCTSVTNSRLLNQEQLDTHRVAPSLFDNQLFSIIDYSPSWTYAGLETKVVIKVKFLMNKELMWKHKWSCMFGQTEVPVDIFNDGTLCCNAPLQKSGRVPFYLTCSNGLACSEVRDFEYKVFEIEGYGNLDSYESDDYEINLQLRFEKLLILESVDHSNHELTHANERDDTQCTVCSLMIEENDELLSLFKQIPDEDFCHSTAKSLLLQEPLKERLHSWLLHKVGDGGKGPNVLDKEGQGVVHLAAALGYDWAVKPAIAAGVNINFRDVHGWTALHWAAFCGRERTVVTLIALSASPGALTDPNPEFPSGRTPADLASQNGHKGIAGFLAESSLINHLRALTLEDWEGSDLSESSCMLFHDVAENSNSYLASRKIKASLQDSLSAVRNATEAAARIYQVFRVQSFHRKKIIEYGDDNSITSHGRALSLISLRSNRSGHYVMPVHAAATKIQNKFRGWKGRKEFLVIRQGIVKIQAHVRGHQVRKHYRKILWSVGIVEKAVLRWRRKGSGLRGFRPEGMLEDHLYQNQVPKEDDYDFLQEGRKQTEARLEIALARVKSMVQYPEARDQYRRLLSVVTELQESKFMQAENLNEMLEPADVDLMTELEGLLADDTLMQFAL